MYASLVRLNHQKGTQGAIGLKIRKERLVENGACVTKISPLSAQANVLRLSGQKFLVSGLCFSKLIRITFNSPLSPPFPACIPACLRGGMESQGDFE